MNTSPLLHLVIALLVALLVAILAEFITRSLAHFFVARGQRRAAKRMARA